jgi:predicted flap endonuclease-1-like 5' DNA nuclease
MMELVETNWPLLVAALLIGIVVAWWIFVASRRTKVSHDRRDVLDEGADPAARNQALIDSAPAASVITPAEAPVSVPAGVGSGAGERDDLTRIKGVGPKLADLLASLGVTSFAQVAGWTDADIDRIDTKLGRFEGRIRRDDWREQARLLAAGDNAAYEEKFGRL